MNFFDRLGERIVTIDSIVSVGLDADLDRIPDHLHEYDLPRWAFNRRIIDATHEHAAVYKPNVAFYEDGDGWAALKETIAYAHGKGVPVLLDAKRGDIGNTARKYANLLDMADAITVNPYMGRDSLDPFLSREDKGVFILCRTSNPGGTDIQDLELASGETIYEWVASLADLWNANGNVGLVVGATTPDELEEVRERVPDLPFLVPGVGAQGGDVEAAATYATADGAGLVNSSRGIIFAGENAGKDFHKASGQAAKQLKKQLNQYR
ncbi:orotidine-5'-phosphate decarboxylase [Haladaptatus sp. DFWS20]|uniref:orotidine-5'-phosphate decarboxylase n=1 Tax=Haladaptatus sp. DFWS20 TaxID=3403467 RepID=UPI003EB73650